MTFSYAVYIGVVLLEWEANDGTTENVAVVRRAVRRPDEESGAGSNFPVALSTFPIDW